MRLLSMFILCLSAWAVDGGPETYEINGVSLGGTLAAPSIINHHPSKAVLGWVVAALDSSGNVIRYEENINAIDLVNGTTSIPAGSEFSISQRRNQVRVRGMAQVASQSLDSVLFMDGEVAGPDNMGHALSVFQSELDSITAHEPAAALHAPLPYGHQRPIPGKWVAHDFGAGYGPTLTNYIGEILTTDGFRDFYYGSDPPPQTGTVINPPYQSVFTPSVGGTAVCGMDSPYSGYGVGGFDLGYLISCPASNYSLVSRTGSNRPDGVMDRLIQTGNVYNLNNGNLQNRDVMLEGCFPGDGGELGYPVVVTSQGYGCR